MAGQHGGAVRGVVGGGFTARRAAVDGTVETDGGAVLADGPGIDGRTRPVAGTGTHGAAAFVSRTETHGALLIGRTKTDGALLTRRTETHGTAVLVGRIEMDGRARLVGGAGTHRGALHRARTEPDRGSAPVGGAKTDGALLPRRTETHGAAVLVGLLPGRAEPDRGVLLP
ncbi:hypothetical protein [Streptomyces scabiei]|uniref:hypothetical protein n=1 Tax=Streptomyces scabiei TaxID=1930 RepID=UPI000765AC2B|nr:hypothetical protein [Streptomyces scabiei]